MKPSSRIFRPLAASLLSLSLLPALSQTAWASQLSIKLDLLRLRIRWGETFSFPMRLDQREEEQENSGEGAAAGILRLSGLGERPLSLDGLPGYPLPQESARTARQLQRRLTAMTDSYSGQWSVYVKNLTTDESFIINDAPMKSASVMKLFVLGTVYQAIDSQELERTQEIVDLITNMICYSSNEATNQLLYLMGDGSYAAGIQKVNEYIASQGYSSMTHEYNGFNDPSTYTDPDRNNQVSAKDCGLLLERVYRRTFGSWKICNEVEDLMLNQDTRYKIPGGLPEEALVGNKTGEMSTVENDVAIVYTDEGDYILCVLSQDWDSGDEAISRIQEISALVYEYFSDPAYYEAQEPDSFDELASLAASWDLTAQEETEAETETETESEETEPESGLIDWEAAFPLLNEGAYSTQTEDNPASSGASEETSDRRSES